MNAYGFMPHGFCFEWRPSVLWLHVLSDLGIAIAYYFISFVLFYFTRKRRGLPFQGLFWLFAAFITLCGTTHLFSIWVLWFPDYYIEGFVKAITAIVSIATLVSLTQVLPKALLAAQSMEDLIATRGSELEDANRELRSQIAARESIESALRQSQKMEAIGQLTGGIAHDFNNMLQAIGSSLEVMETRIGENRASEAINYADGARKTVERATALTNRLLAFARRQPLQASAVNIDSLITGLQPLISSTLSTVSAVSAAIQLDLDLNDGGWAVQCDPNQLESAFLNITINARDAMPQGGKLMIRTKQTVLGAPDAAGDEGVPAGDYIEIAITDTGTGMDEATRLRVFEPFFTTKPTGRGTGLGLSQVYGFTRQSGGLVRLESAPGQGTTVRLFLRRSKQAEKTRAKILLAAAPRAAGKASLLLVEDEPLVRQIAAEYLRGLGYEVEEAEDSTAALEIFEGSPAFDLLVTDVGLPNGLNGRQLADALRELAPDLPVLFITGYAGAANLDQLDPGMKILVKPFGLPALAAQIEAMLAAVSEP